MRPIRIALTAGVAVAALVFSIPFLLGFSEARFQAKQRRAVSRVRAMTDQELLSYDGRNDDSDTAYLVRQQIEIEKLRRSGQ